MKPRRRPRPLVVPRYVAQRAVSWHKTLTPAQKDPSLGQSAPSYRIRDINGNRWNAHVCYGGTPIKTASYGSRTCQVLARAGLSG